MASLVHMPAWVLRELNMLVFNFFWKGKRDLVPRSAIILPVSSGGFSVIDVQSKVHALAV